MIDSHRGAFEYDWRTRFHQPLSDVGTEAMTWGEALRLVALLAADPSSQVAARFAAWERPISREEMVLADLFDVQLASKSKKKPSPYPRPWAKTGSTSERKGNAAGRSRAEVVEILNAHGHSLPVP